MRFNYESTPFVNVVQAVDGPIRWFQHGFEDAPYDSSLFRRLATI